jgi:rod shape-determining protein MreD
LSVVRAIVAAFAVFILQVTIVHRMSVIGARPDLMLVLLVVLVLDRNPVMAIVIGFSLGFLQDLGNASFLGMNALAKSLIGYGIARYASGFLPESTFFKGLLILVASLVSSVIVLNIMSTFNPLTVVVSFFRHSILSAIYSAIAGVIVFLILKLFPRRVVRSGGRY